MAAAVARFAASNLAIGDCIEVEQSMMMASTRSPVAAATATTRSPAVDADDRVDRPAALGEIGIVVDVDRNALLFS